MHITVGPRQSVTAGHSPVRSLFIPDLQWNEFPRPPQSGATRVRLLAPTASVAMPWPPDLRFWFWKMFLQFPCFPSLSPHAVRFRRETMEPLDEETWLPEWQREGNKSPRPLEESHWMVMWARNRLSWLSYDATKVWGCWRSCAPGETKAVSAPTHQTTLCLTTAFLSSIVLLFLNNSVIMAELVTGFHLLLWLILTEHIPQG